MSTNRVHTDIITVALDGVDTSAYASGDLIDDKITITDADNTKSVSGVIHSVVVTDLAKQSADLDLVIFDSDPSSTTFTDNGAFDVDDTDLPKIVGVAQITTHVTFNDNSVSIAHGTNIPFRVPSGVSLYGALVSRGTPTYVSATDLQVRIGILED